MGTRTRTRTAATSRARTLAICALSSVGASVWCTVALFGTGCAKAPNPGPASSQEAPKVLSPFDAGGAADRGDASTSGDRAPGTPDASAPTSLREALLRQDWTSARAALSALPPETQKTPLHRYVAAKIAYGLKDTDAVLVALTGLENELPELRDRILELRAESAAVKGPYDVATDHWLRRGGATAGLRAAAVFAKNGDPQGLTRAVSVVLADPKRSPREETEARALRLGLPQLAGLDDARWLFIHAPGHTSAKNVEAVFARENATKVRRLVSDAEMKARMDAWSHAGKPDEAIQELAELQKSHAVSWSPQAFCKARGQILYSARSKYADAAATYASCAALGGKEQPENLFLEARSYSRANQDDVAIKKYAELARKFPRSPQAAQAKQLRARLLTLNAHYADAAKAWDELPQSDDRDRLRAIAHLLAGHAQTAEGILSRIADGRSRSTAHALRMRELHALSMDAAGNTRGAVEAWKAVVAEAPLSYAAMIARERLLARNVSADAMPVAKRAVPFGTTPDLRNVTLTPGLAMFASYAQLGLGDEAEDALAAREAEVRKAPNSDGVDALCTAYAATGRARRRFRLAPQTSTDVTREAAHDCRYPAPFSEIMLEASRASSIPVPFSYAIMRTESAFDPVVHSPAAAVGLMQLLPDTARRVGDKAQIPSAPLEDARVNIFLGVRYLEDLASELKASLPFVAAAYNAGPEAVQRWLSHLTTKTSTSKTIMDAALFCELIPYGETRAYVFQVMESFAHYAYRSGTQDAQTVQDAQDGGVPDGSAGGSRAASGNGGELPRFSLALPPL